MKQNVKQNKAHDEQIVRAKLGQEKLLWNSQNREHQKYLWNLIVLRETSQ